MNHLHMHCCDCLCLFIFCVCLLSACRACSSTAVPAVLQTMSLTKLSCPASTALLW